MDIRPAALFSDERVYRLAAEHRFAYIALQAYATVLNATTGSEFVDGDFSLAEALLRVRDLTEDDIDALIGVGLVAQVDGDRHRVQFTTEQTSHEALQARADGYAARAETRANGRAARKQANSDQLVATEHRRELDRTRQQRKRHRDLMGAETASPYRDEPNELADQADQAISYRELERIHAAEYAVYDDHFAHEMELGLAPPPLPSRPPDPLSNQLVSAGRIDHEQPPF